MATTAHKQYDPRFINARWVMSDDFTLYVNEPAAGTKRKMGVVTSISHTAKYKIGTKNKAQSVYLCDLEKNSGDRFGTDLSIKSIEKVVMLHDNYGSFEVEGAVVDVSRYDRIKDDLQQNKRNLQLLKQDLRRYRESLAMNDAAGESQDVDQPYPPLSSPAKTPKGSTMFGGGENAKKTGSNQGRPPTDFEVSESPSSRASTTKSKGNQLDTWKQGQPPIDKFAPDIDPNYFKRKAGKSDDKEADDDDDDNTGMPPLVQITQQDRLWILYEKNNIISPLVFINLPYY